MTLLNDDLSEREREILRLLATGASNKEISTRLAISPNTVKVHIRNIFAKIGVSSRTEAALYAVKAGLAVNAAVAGELKDDSFPSDEIEFDRGQMPGTRAGELSSEVYPGSLSSTAFVPEQSALAPQARQRRWLFAGFGALALLLVALVVWRLYQPATPGLSALPNDPNRWSTLPHLPTARYAMAVTASEGLIYAIGGQAAQGPTGVVERYDPAQNTWVTLAPKPTPVDEISCAIVGGKIFVPGGRAAGGQTMDRLEVYDPRSDTWKQGASLPVSLSAYALAAFEGRLYLFGGWDGQQFVNTVYRYDPASDGWTQAGKLRSPRGYASAAVVGRKIYVLGGYNGRKALSDNLIYQPDLADSGDPWGEGQALPTGRYGMGVSVIAEIVEVVGGIQDDGTVPLSLSYFPFNDAWQEFGELEGGPLLYPGSAAVGNFLYIFGGQLNGQPTAQHQAYQAIYSVSFPIIR